MNRTSAQFPTITDVAAILLILMATVYVDVGFFRTDTRLLNSIGSHSRVSLVLWGLRIGTLLAGLAVVYVYYGLKYRRLSAASMLLALIAMSFTVLIVFPLVVYYYGKKSERHIALFHPYLQLLPPTYHEPQGDPSSQTLKIFCLGGSTTEFPDSKGRDWPALVQHELQKAVPDRSIQVSNLGRRWYTSLHTLINYQTNLRKHKPDVLLVTHTINDLLHNADFSFLSTGPFREDYGHFLGPLYRYVKLRSVFGAARSTLDLVWYAPDREVVETQYFPGLATFRDNLVALIQLARADGTQVVLITQPYLVKEGLTRAEKKALNMVNYEAVGPTKRWSYRTAKFGMEQYSACVRQVATETAVNLIDLEKVVPKQLDYMYDDVHYTDKAYDLISRTIAAKLVDFRLLDH